MIGILRHPRIPHSHPLADEIGAWLATHDQAVWHGSVWDSAELQSQIDVLSLLIVLGGDGSILRGARIAAPAKVPVFSVNLGKLGFLSEASPDNWLDRLTLYLAGKHWLERRLMVEATIYRDSAEIGTIQALNEVVIGRGRQARLITTDLYVNEDYVTTYTCDGLIAATPTGSTAYSLAAGGPILPPQLDNFLVNPVAPHLSLNRAIILPGHASVRVQLSMDHEAALTADGQESISLEDGDDIIVCKAPYQALFVRARDDSYFYRRLMGNLGLDGKRSLRSEQ
jgi:NAD+ kinase